jgi:hypothetical protein
MNRAFDTAFAKQVLESHITRLRALNYSQLFDKLQSGEIETGEILSQDGMLYQWECLFYWDSNSDEDVRVIISVFLDPRRTAVNDSFIVSPNGSFVGE